MFKWFMSSSWIAWSLIPTIAAVLGTLTTIIFVKLLEHFHILRPEHAIEHTKRQSRSESLQKSSVSESEQVKIAAITLLGPSVWLNAFMAAIVLPIAIEDAKNLPLHPSLELFAIHFLALHLLGDLFLYAAHRVLHEVHFLWRHFHMCHHEIKTTVAASVGYIHAVDTTFQSGIPIVSSALIVQPHPLTFTWYVYCRVSENTLNHCGYEHPLLNLLWAKWLPLRASVGHHDQHHHFGNYGKGAKNLGEFWIIWDWLFGTLRPVSQIATGNLD
eukprot:CAMPEP_0195252300 /NCGR_PEP_ID=MMETSP0706-20130129/3785_1 /TAXON_ID=33640 /ORGANISM="Asterionellopsis glacialis, Strain CCMP134" /LENGTH=271 /DNA_ID=CAMNT_0040304579 /DNA_START=124 /DNA_END=939 /DNA_ORIENTATION=-